MGGVGRWTGRNGELRTPRGGVGRRRLDEADEFVRACFVMGYFKEEWVEGFVEPGEVIVGGLMGDPWERCSCSGKECCDLFG